MQLKAQDLVCIAQQLAQSQVELVQEIKKAVLAEIMPEFKQKQIMAKDYTQEISNLQSQIKQIQSTSTQQIQILKAQITSLSNKIAVASKQNEGFWSKLEFKLQEQTSKMLKTINQQLQMGNKQKAVEKKEESLFDSTSPFFKEFRIVGQQVEYIGKNSEPTQIIGKSSGKRISVTFQIVLCKHKKMSLGIIDRRYAEVDRSSTSRPHSSSYTSGGGFIQRNIRQGWSGEGFETGDVVKLTAEVETGWFIVEVNGRQHVHVSQVLQDERIEWVPFFQFFNTGDKIIWRNQ